MFIASLTQEEPQTTISLYIALIDEATLLVKGNGIIHVIGFSEPDPEAGYPFES